MSVGEKLRALRQDRPLSDTARALGISEEALMSYETGIRLPRDEVKIRIAIFYGVGLEEIF